MTPPDPVAAMCPLISPEPTSPSAVRARPATPPAESAGRTRPAEERLAAVERLMHSLVAAGPPDPAGAIAGEHLATGGKRLRAWLALSAGDALDAPARPILCWAAACELLHNATLVHDDIQDGDRVRRGVPTAWVTHGTAQAITAGDLLLMLPFLAVSRAEAPGEVRAALSAVLASHAAAAARGQAADLATGAHRVPDWPAYRGIAEGKTSALFQLPVHGAALIAGLSEAEARGLAAPFRRLGVLFQLQDDILDLYGDKGREGPGNDLRQGRPGILVSEHLRLVPGDAKRLAATLSGSVPCDPAGMALLFRQSGALAAALRRLRREREALLRSPALRFRPALLALARTLADRAVEPIAPLVEEVGR